MKLTKFLIIITTLFLTTLLMFTTLVKSKEFSRVKIELCRYLPYTKKIVIDEVKKILNLYLTMGRVKIINLTRYETEEYRFYVKNVSELSTVLIVGA